jgi:PAS domain S-box-containing protein
MHKLAITAVLRQIKEGVIVTDVIGTITFVNEAAATIHGVAQLNIQPNAYSETYHLFQEDGRPYPSYELPLARAVRGETVVDARWRIRRPDGVDVLAVGTAQPLLNADGRRIGAILTLRDETARDKAERALKKSEAALQDARRLLAEQKTENCAV